MKNVHCNGKHSLIRKIQAEPPHLAAFQQYLQPMKSEGDKKTNQKLIKKARLNSILPNSRTCTIGRNSNKFEKEHLAIFVQIFVFLRVPGYFLSIRGTRSEPWAKKFGVFLSTSFDRELSETYRSEVSDRSDH